VVQQSAFRAGKYRGFTPGLSLNLTSQRGSLSGWISSSAVTPSIESMPTYEFRCPDGTIIERIYKISEAPDEIPSPNGDGMAVRIISGGAGLLFKGSGFYITDYGKDGKKDQRAASEKASGSASSESKSSDNASSSSSSSSGNSSAAPSTPAASSSTPSPVSPAPAPKSDKSDK
jgi:predicted nucleic acid-binding Zn ribbon protein